MTLFCKICQVTLRDEIAHIEHCHSVISDKTTTAHYICMVDGCDRADNGMTTSLATIKQHCLKRHGESGRLLYALISEPHVVEYIANLCIVSLSSVKSSSHHAKHRPQTSPKKSTSATVMNGDDVGPSPRSSRRGNSDDLNMSLIGAYPFSRIKEELRKRGLPTTGSSDLCRQALEDAVEQERSGTKSQSAAQQIVRSPPKTSTERPAKQKKSSTIAAKKILANAKKSPAKTAGVSSLGEGLVGTRNKHVTSSSGVNPKLIGAYPLGRVKEELKKRGLPTNLNGSTSRQVLEDAVHLESSGANPKSLAALLHQSPSSTSKKVSPKKRKMVIALSTQDAYSSDDDDDEEDILDLPRY